MRFDPWWRERAIEGLGRPYDLVVVGGGITGAGILLDATQRGLRTLLVERDDIASGTSSRSSKLIHGGLRYLKQMQFRITRIACRERDRLLVAAPHLVEPIRFLYPAYESDRTPGWQVDLGLWMYDRLTSPSHRHRHVEEEGTEDLAPGLSLEGLDRAMIYVDGRTDDARLTLAVAAAGAARGGHVLTRAEVLSGWRDGAGRLAGVDLLDRETGRSHRVEASVVVNATGHWTDAVRERFGLEGERVRPSRGVHLVLPTDRLPIRVALAVASPDDGRPVFLIPHPEGVIVGTTDHYHEGSLDDPRATPEEVAYLLRAAAHAFPSRDLGEADVRGVWAGLRPILAGQGTDPTAASREEAIWEEAGLLSVAGGKLTTYRVTARLAVDEVVERLAEARRRVLAPPSDALALAHLAPPDLAVRLGLEAGLEPPLADALARRLGDLAWAAIDLARGEHELRPLVEGGDLCLAEVRAWLRYGAVLRLEDLLLRRARVGMWEPEGALAVAERTAPAFADHLGWPASRWERELEGLAGALEGWRPPEAS